MQTGVPGYHWITCDPGVTGGLVGPWRSRPSSLMYGILLPHEPNIHTQNIKNTGVALETCGFGTRELITIGAGIKRIRRV